MTSDFFAMGGYAAFVWPAWGLTAGTMIGLALISWRDMRNRQAVLRELQGTHSP